MENVLKITNVLADPTRYSIYEYLITNKKAVDVQEIADQFSIHPNVARLHLSKLEEIKLILSFSYKSGKGGRPSRKYKLSNYAIELSFPYRDYALLAKIAIESMASLGEAGKVALYNTGRKFGEELSQRYFIKNNTTTFSSLYEKVNVVKEITSSCGLYPSFDVNEECNVVQLAINNCPFKEIIHSGDEYSSICNMHLSFLQGIFEEVFPGTEIKELEIMPTGCEQCIYQATVTNVTN